MSRLDDLVRFYSVLGDLERKIGGRRLLAICNGRMNWPRHGVYFFMEDGEERTDTGGGLRIVRVGTHALTETSRTTLWGRLSQHKGRHASGSGNHRASIFRLLVGSTLAKNEGHACSTWGVNNMAPPDVRLLEQGLERQVSKIIGDMPFLWLAVDAPSGGGKLRGYVERNSIALLSNLGKSPIDQASVTWRGLMCDRGKARVKESGLWNQNHVDETYDPSFLNVLEELVDRAGGAL